MAKRLNATEKLAREICWKGFNSPKNAGAGRSANEYWKRVHTDSRKGYLEHAAELIWWTRRIGSRRLQKAVEEHDQHTGRDLLPRADR